MKNEGKVIDYKENLSETERAHECIENDLFSLRDILNL